MTSKLLPCPFCGELPVITKHLKFDIYSFMHRCSVIGPIYRDFRESEQGHIDMWNTRAAPLSPDHSGGGAGVVLPERKPEVDYLQDEYESGLAEGWNACLDKVKELNQ